MHDTAAFSACDERSASALAALIEMGFEIGPSRSVTRTLLDTFDGRLRATGLQLELREADGLELILSGDRTVPAHLTVSAVPRFPADLPSGPFRSRLAPIVDVRALLPIMRLRSLSTPAVWRDEAQKAIVFATVHEHQRVDDHSIDLAPWSIEIHEVAGYRKRAAKARDVLEGLGLERFDGDTFAAAAAVAGIDLTGFSGSPTVPLDPTMTAVHGFCDVLGNLADTVSANWQGTIDQIDPEFLHDLRVGVRRTRSILARGTKVLPLTAVEHARERFSWLGARTGPARDLDVHLIEWDRYAAPLGAEAVAALEPVRALLEHRRVEAHAALTCSLQSAEATDFMTAWRAWLKGPARDQPHGVHAAQPLGPVVVKSITRAQAVLVERGRQIRADTPADQVHDLRKDAKKLRYLLECFGGLLPADSRKAFVRRLKALQENLGAHQDAEVHVAELRAIARELPPGAASRDTLVAIGQLTERLDQRRIAARVEFAERFAAYDAKATRRILDAALHGVAR